MKFNLILESILNEAMSLDNLWKKYGEKFKTKIESEYVGRELWDNPFTGEILYDNKEGIVPYANDKTYKGVMFDLVDYVDPQDTPNQISKYSEWIIKQYLNDSIELDSFLYDPVRIYNESEYLYLDIQTKSLQELIKYFKEYLPYISNKDILAYKTPADLAKAISSAAPSPNQITKLVKKHTPNILFKGKNYTVYSSESWEEEVSLAPCSGWCTADSRKEWGEKYYNKYTDNNKYKLVVLVPNSRERKNWLQFSTNPHPRYRDCEWGYYDGQTNIEKPKLFLATDTESINWAKDNADIIRYFYREYPFILYNYFSRDVLLEVPTKDNDEEQ